VTDPELDAILERASEAVLRTLGEQVDVEQKLRELHEKAAKTTKFEQLALFELPSEGLEVGLRECDLSGSEAPGIVHPDE
jgi:hypothetical protein